MGLWHLCEHEPPCGQTYDAERYDRCPNHEPVASVDAENGDEIHVSADTRSPLYVLVQLVRSRPPRKGLKVFKEAFTAVLDPPKARILAAEVLARCRETERTGSAVVVRDLMLELGVHIGDLIQDLEADRVIEPGFAVVVGTTI